MKSFAQFICESSSDAFRLNDPIWKYFNPEKIKETLDYLDNYKCRATLIWISPDLFLKLARSGHDSYKEETVKKYAESTGLSDIPSLMFKDDTKGTAYITGHEGRHRARFFKEKGFKLIPVEFCSNRIRWGSQDNKFDHIDVWPTVLVSEDGVSKVPFPDSAIFPHKEMKESIYKTFLSEEINTKYRFLGSCIELNGNDINNMKDVAKQISWKTFYTFVDKKSVKEEFPDYDWRAKPKELTIEKDRTVGTWKSEFKGKPCVYITHSGIEYVFIGNKEPSNQSKAVRVVSKKIYSENDPWDGSEKSRRIEQYGILSIGDTTPKTHWKVLDIIQYKNGKAQFQFKQGWYDADAVLAYEYGK